MPVGNYPTDNQAVDPVASPIGNCEQNNKVTTPILNADYLHERSKVTDCTPPAVLRLADGREFQLNVLKPTYGAETILDVQTLYKQGKILLYDPGFNSIASCASAVTIADGDKGECRYRGYSVADLVEKHDFLNVAYLLLNGELPTEDERLDFESRVKSEMLVHSRLKEFITRFVPGAHPMSILASVLAAMASFYADPMDAKFKDDKEIRLLACIRLIAKIPTVCAMAYKVLVGEPFVYPRRDLSYAENFIYMMFANPTGPYEIDPLHAEIIDNFLTIHADHEQNASTSTVRTAGSSLANPYACIATGVTSLWGRAHGGANEAVVDMLESIADADEVPAFVEKVKRKEVRLMGFGHRVYRNYDPRAKIMQSLCHRLFAQAQRRDPLFDVAKKLEAVALSDDYFKSRHLYPNVDFYSGIVMRGLGIPKEMFTVMFAMGRTVGWLSHWAEMVDENIVKITRPRQWYVGVPPRSIPEGCKRPETNWRKLKCDMNKTPRTFAECDVERSTNKSKIERAASFKSRSLNDKS